MGYHGQLIHRFHSLTDVTRHTYGNYVPSKFLTAMNYRLWQFSVVATSPLDMPLGTAPCPPVAREKLAVPQIAVTDLIAIRSLIKRFWRILRHKLSSCS